MSCVTVYTTQYFLSHSPLWRVCTVYVLFSPNVQLDRWLSLPRAGCHPLASPVACWSCRGKNSSWSVSLQECECQLRYMCPYKEANDSDFIRAISFKVLFVTIKADSSHHLDKRRRGSRGSTARKSEEFQQDDSNPSSVLWWCWRIHVHRYQQKGLHLAHNNRFSQRYNAYSQVSFFIRNPVGAKTSKKKKIVCLQLTAAPFWLEKPTDLVLAPEESGRLVCRSDGAPRPTVSWFINGEPIECKLSMTRWTVCGATLNELLLDL